MTKDEALKLALEGLEQQKPPADHPKEWNSEYWTAIVAIREALAQPVLNPAPGYCKHCKDYTIEEPMLAQPAPQPAIAQPVQPTIKQSLTVAEQSTELDAGMAAQHYCRGLWGAARGHSDWRKVHEHFSNGYKQGVYDNEMAQGPSPWPDDEPKCSHEWVNREKDQPWLVCEKCGATYAATTTKPAAQAEPVAWEYRWLNPDNYSNTTERMLAWQRVEPTRMETLENKLQEFRAYTYLGKPCYEVRALYTTPPSQPAARAQPPLPVQPAAQAEPMASPYVTQAQLDRAFPAPAAQAEPQQKCWCTTCHPITALDIRFVVCPDCGNKRCPKAHNHTNACTNSNEPGQPGSSWEHIKPAAQAKPVAWWIPKAQHFCMPPKDGNRPSAKQWEPLYTTPTPQRQPLTDERIEDVYRHISDFNQWVFSAAMLKFARAIEVAHGIGAKP